ncbi:MAG: TetR/AcrR family transcriptional regulator [Candidatus Aminicenantia bacterium]
MRTSKKRVDEILRAAEIVFSNNGFHNSTMDSIALVAKLGKGTIYYYFKSKEEIFFTLIKRESEIVNREMKSMVSGKESLFKIVQKIMSFYLQYFSEKPVFLKIFFPCIAGLINIENKELFSLYTRSYRKHTQFIKSLISRKLKEERIPISLKKLLDLLNIIQIGIGLKLLEGKEREAKNALKHFLEIMKKFLEG